MTRRAAAQHQSVLADALAPLPEFSSSGQILDLSAQWADDRDRSWEALVRNEIGTGG